MNVRRVLRSVALLGLVVMFAGMALLVYARSAGLDRAILTNYGALAFAGVAAAFVPALILILTSRCPSCRRWVHPWYAPRPGVHCPHCGKAPAEAAPPQAPAEEEATDETPGG